MVYMRIVLTTLVTITCLLGDNFVELTQHPLLKALADNATHAAIGALTGITFATQFYERTSQLFGWILIFTCFVVSSFIDLDHFVEARSLYLEVSCSNQTKHELTKFPQLARRMPPICRRGPSSTAPAL